MDRGGHGGGGNRGASVLDEALIFFGGNIGELALESARCFPITAKAGVLPLMLSQTARTPLYLWDDLGFTIMQTVPRLTFSQRAGHDPIPTQLALGVLSAKARARLWHVFYQSIEGCIHGSYYGKPMASPWLEIVTDWFVYTDNKLSNQVSWDWADHENHFIKLFTKDEYQKVFNFVEFVLRHGVCPSEIREGVGSVLVGAQTAYIVVDGDTICPIVTEHDAATIHGAFVDLAGTPFDGAKTHLKSAGQFLSQGRYADSVRESIHSVESVARLIAPEASASLDEALRRIDAAIGLHPAFTAGVKKLYGYASDSKGIRHPLLTEETPNVDVHDALYMLCACAAFVSFLVNKGRNAGLMKQPIQQ